MPSQKIGSSRGPASSARPTKTAMLLLEGNKDPFIVAEYEVTLVNGRNRFAINLEGLVARGTLSRVMVNIDSKTAGNGTDLDTYILDSNLLTAAVEGNNTIFSSIGDAINAAVVPDLVLNQVCPDDIWFVTKDLQGGSPAPGQIQIVIDVNGGDGSTSHVATIQIYGEAHA